jgi:hypothetical protein
VALVNNAKPLGRGVRLKFNDQADMARFRSKWENAALISISVPNSSSTKTAMCEQRLRPDHIGCARRLALARLMLDYPIAEG